MGEGGCKITRAEAEAAKGQGCGPRQPVGILIAQKHSGIAKKRSQDVLYG